MVLQFSLFGGVLPGLIVGVTLLAAWWRVRDPARRLWIAPLVFALAMVPGEIMVNGRWPPIWPAGAVDRLPTIAAAVMLVALGESLLAWLREPRWLLIGVLARPLLSYFACAALLWPVAMRTGGPDHTPASSGQWTIVGWTAILMAFTELMSPSATRPSRSVPSEARGRLRPATPRRLWAVERELTHGPPPPLLALTIAALGAAFIMANDTLYLAYYLAAVSAAAGAGVVVAVIRPSFRVVPGGITFLSMMFGSVLLAAYYYADSFPTAQALLLALAPLGGLVAPIAVPPARRWTAILVAGGFAAALTGVAVALAVTAANSPPAAERAAAHPGQQIHPALPHV